MQELDERRAKLARVAQARMDVVDLIHPSSAEVPAPSDSAASATVVDLLNSETSDAESMAEVELLESWAASCSVA